MLDIVLNAPSYIKIGIIFLSILLTYRIGISLGWSMILYSILLTFWSGAGINGFRLQIQGFAKPENYLLLIVIFALLFFTEVLSQSGRMQKTIEALKKWLSNEKMLLGGLPALVGLLPMPGGALFSAPLVKSVDSENKLSSPLIVAINYWFRHIWEYWWPLYPGVILAIVLSGVQPGIYYLTMIPFTPAAIAAGYIFLLKKVRKGETIAHPRSFNLGDISKTLGPIGLLVIISIGGSAFLPRLNVPDSIINLVAMLIGLFLAIFIIVVSNPKILLSSMSMLTSKKNFSILCIVIGVQLFYTTLKLPVGSDSINLVTMMKDEFNSMGIPIILVMIILPFISGLITGIAFAYVGASFPLVFELLGADPSISELIATTALSYGIGFVGMILSPVHICFVVTNEYFNSRMHRAYKFLFWPALTIFCVTLLLSGLYFILL